MIACNKESVYQRITTSMVLFSKYIIHVKVYAMHSTSLLLKRDWKTKKQNSTTDMWIDKQKSGDAVDSREVSECALLNRKLPKVQILSAERSQTLFTSPESNQVNKCVCRQYHGHYWRSREPYNFHCCRVYHISVTICSLTFK